MEQTEKRHIFKKGYEVRFFDCTPEKTARVSVFLRIMGDYAGVDYTERGYGHDELWDRGMVFLLSRVSVHFERMPRADEKLVFSTWEHGIEGPMFYRYFEITDESGDVIADASTAWLLVDPVSRKILRPGTFNGEFRIVADKQVKAGKPARIKLPDGAQTLGRRTAYYSDLDENGHMNNSHYADIAFDFLPEGLRKKQITDFMINYNHEALEGDLLEIKAAETENGVIIGADFAADCLENANGKQESCFTASIKFK